MTVPFLKSNTHIVDLSGISIWHPVRWNYQSQENFSAFSPRYSGWVASGYTMTVNAMRWDTSNISLVNVYSLPVVVCLWPWWDNFEEIPMFDISTATPYLIYWLQIAPYFIFQSLSNFLDVILHNGICCTLLNL